MPAPANVIATVPFADVVGEVWFVGLMKLSQLSVVASVVPVPLLAVFPDKVMLQFALHVK